jgi:hypothetical protein
MSALTRRRLRQFLLAHAEKPYPTSAPAASADFDSCRIKSCGIKLAALPTRAQAARSLVIRAVRLQQSAMISHTPSLRHTLTYFPCSASIVPSAWRDIR